MTRVAAVLVTHNSARWIDDTLASVRSQSRPPDTIVVVDDNSDDDTVEILRAAGVEAIPATCEAWDVVTRIAANFVQGVQLVADHDLVVLGDHDDRWRPERVEHQIDALEARPDALMVASDGAIGDSTIRATFPVAAVWDTMDAADRMRYALRHSIATGAASALRPAAFPDLTVPPGWLHDRWWSLVATARAGMVVDRTVVIDYRVGEGQQVGLDRAAQGHGAIGRFVALFAHARRSLGKQRDLRDRLRAMALTDDIRSSITLASVVRPPRRPAGAAQEYDGQAPSDPALSDPAPIDPAPIDPALSDQTLSSQTPSSQVQDRE